MPRFIRRVCVLILLVVVVPLLPTSNPPAARSAGLLSSSPEALAVTVALGEQAEVSLILQNDSAEPITPRLFTGEVEAVQPLVHGPARVPVATTRPAGWRGSVIDPALTAAQQADPEGQADLLILLADQADLSPAYAIRDWAARGTFVYQTLRDHAAASQGQVRALLEARGLAYTPLWIVNGLAVRGTAADVQALAGLATVAEMRLLRVASLSEVDPGLPAQVANSCLTPDDLHCWNLQVMGVDRAWAAFGARGAGITVANLDSGVRFDHPALLAQYRGNTPSGLSHSYHWYDSLAGRPVPEDSGNHGTHTMGTMVARSLPAVGVAPDARWIAARACSTRECTELNLIRAAQWLLAPTDLNGLNPRPDLRPHIINNSWTAGQNADWYLGYVVAWRAAGIYPVFAGGNTGNLVRCSTIQSPGDYAEVTAVGASDSSNRLTSFSSIGPGPEGRNKPDLIAPGSWIVSTVANQQGFAPNSGTSMAAPHIAGAVALLWSANPSLIGDYERTYAALTATAQPIVVDPRFQNPEFVACRPDSVPNNLFGYGLPDLYAALAQIHPGLPWLSFPVLSPTTLEPGAQMTVRLWLDARQVPGPGRYQANVLVHSNDLGAPPLMVPVRFTVLSTPDQVTLTGQVIRAADAAPLEATVTVEGGVQVMSAQDGRFQVILPAEALPVRLTISAREYLSQTLELDLAAGQAHTLLIALKDDRPQLVVSNAPQALTLDFPQTGELTFLLSNLGTRALSYTVTVANEAYGVWRSDEPTGPVASWRAPPPTVQTLDLGSKGVSLALPLDFMFPYFGRTYDQIWVAANGMIGFSPLVSMSQGFLRGCLPIAESLGPALAILRAELDPSVAGARVSLAQLPEGALISWEQVGLVSDPAQRLSFQALLHRDGRITMHYQDLAGLSANAGASVGLQRDQRELQVITCREQGELATGLTIELRPQPEASNWLTVDAAPRSLAPGASTVITATARWFAPLYQPWPVSGVLLIHSNDLTQPAARLTVRLETTRAPHQIQLPLVAR
ncbi:MAG: S8 family serine peptidase [Oscillochloridaceae bacterium umkhey_bin13]